MRGLITLSKKGLFVSSAVLAGITILLLFLIFNLNRTILHPDFHKKLFVSNDIYSHTQTVINTSMNEFLSDFKKNSPENYKEYSSFFTVLEKSMTKEMIHTNLDMLREGLFSYFRGDRQFLPDLYLYSEKELSETMKSTEKSSTEAHSVLSKIKKINLSAILLYINRNDISDSLFIIKFLFFVINMVPGFLLLFFLSFSLLGLILSKKPIQLWNWALLFLAITGIASTLGGGLLILFQNLWLPAKIHPMVMSIPLNLDVIQKYINDLIFPIIIGCFLLGGFLLSLTFFLHRFVSPSLLNTDSLVKQSVSIHRNYFRNWIYVVIFLLVSSAIVYQVEVGKKTLEEEDYAIAFSKLRNANKITEVIPAKNGAIYGLNVRVVNKETKKPVSNVSVQVSGKSSMQKKNLYYDSITNDEGYAKYKLDQGIFRISFSPSNFPADYQIPSPFFFDLKSPGTTTITVPLDNIPEEKSQMWGVVEIEVLDKENMPVGNIELSAQDQSNLIPSMPKALPPILPPDNNYAVTNEDGIAVFKLPESQYRIHFTADKLPLPYIPPMDFDVKITSNVVNRYTLRLVSSE